MGPLRTAGRRLSVWLLVLALCGWGTGAGADTDIALPDMGNSASGALSPERAHLLGESLMRQLRSAGLLLEDPLLQSYLDSLGYGLASHSDQAQGDFTFFLVDEGSINAFAAPGGYIGIHTGLLLTAESESELAAVLAHEITHVTQHHMARTYEAAGRFRLAAAIAVLAAVLVGSQSGDLAQAAVAAGVATGAQMQIDFTRANEKEADRIGIQMLARAGYDPASMADFFERMQRSTRLYGVQLPEFLSTHPVTADRIAEARSFAARQPRSGSAASLDFHLMRARLQVLGASDAEAAKDLFDSAAPGSAEARIAHRYGRVLALIENREFGSAREALAPLLKQDPHRIAYLIASARIEHGAGHTRRALKIFEDALRNYPYNRALTHYFAEILLESGQPKRAAETLGDYVAYHSADAAMYSLYARAADEAGRRAEAYRAMAEYYFLVGETRAAIQQLTQASRVRGLNYYEASRIEARLEQLKAIAKAEENA